MDIEDADAALKAETERVNNGLQLRGTAEELYKNNEITEAEYSEMMTEYGYCSAREYVVQRCGERMSELVAVNNAGGAPVRFVYDTGYKKTLSSDAGLTMTVLQYMILMYALRVVIAVIFAVFSLGVASIARNLTLSFGITAGSTLLPTLLYSAGFDRAGFVSFGDFFGVNGLVRFSSMENAFGHPLGAFILYGVLFTAVSVVLTLISRARFTK